MSKINFFALGGQDEKGRNCYILKIGDDIFMLDSGVKHPVVSTLGIDTIIPNYDYIKTHLNNFKGIFISSGHDHSIAAIPWLLMQVKKVKIYASEFVAKIIKNRISKYQIKDSSYEIIVIKEKIKIGQVTICPFLLASSIPGTLAYDFQTNQGDFLYMSSFVLNTLINDFDTTNLEVIKKSISPKGLLALAIDSGTANYHGYANEKARIRPLIEEKIKKFDPESRIIIVAYDEQMATLHEVLHLAIDYNRPVILYGKNYSMLLNEFRRMNPNVKMPKFINYQNIDEVKNAIILVTGTSYRLYQRLDRISEKRDVFLKLSKKDLVIVIAPPINGHEKFSSRAEDKVAEITSNLVDISRDDFFLAQPADQDLKKIFEAMKPKYVLPIRGLYVYLSIAARLAKEARIGNDKIIILQNGKQAIFLNGKLESQNKIIKNTQEVLIDGFGIGDIVGSVINERENLGSNGLIIISILINKETKKLMKNIQIQNIGVVNAIKETGFNELVIGKIKDFFNDDIKKNWKFIEAQGMIRKIATKVAQKQIFKKPIIIVNIFEN